MPSEDSKTSLSQRVLGIVLAGLWTVLAGAYFALWLQVATIAENTRDMKGSIDRIEARLKVIDDATAIRATDERNRAAARITELEAREKQRNTPK